jgi:TolB protein
MAPTRSRLGFALFVVLAALAGAAPAQATFPGRNGAIAYASNGSSGGPGQIFETSGLYAAFPRARQPRTLVRCRVSEGVPSGGDCSATRHYAPSYSADGRRIVFDAGTQLAVIDADGSNLTLLSATTPNDDDPAFAPDGKRIVFSGSNDRGTTDVYVRRLGGGPARAIVDDASAPAWSSRNEIAYVRDGNIYRADPNGRHRRFVTSGIAPDWSPNGGRLVLIRPAPNLVVVASIGRIYTVGARGRGLRPIGSRRDLANPVWSPDGRWLAFDGFEFGVHKRRAVAHARLYEIAPTQYGSEGAFVSAYSPAWQPR